MKSPALAGPFISMQTFQRSNTSKVDVADA